MSTAAKKTAAKPAAKTADKPGKKEEGAAAAKADGPAPVPGAAAPGHKRTAMEVEFDKLRALDRFEEGVDAIGPEGLKKLAKDLLLPDDQGLEMFVIAWKLNATQSYCITRSEWLHSLYLEKPPVDDMTSLRTRVPKWLELVKESEKDFAAMYNHTYDFIRGDDEKLLPLSKALKAWEALLADRFPHFTEWARWAHGEYKRPVSRDVWRQLLEFAKRVPDLNKYQSHDKWPTAMDDFVEWWKEQQAKGKPPVAAPAA